MFRTNLAMSMSMLLTAMLFVPSVAIADDPPQVTLVPFEFMLYTEMGGSLRYSRETGWEKSTALFWKSVQERWDELDEEFEEVSIIDFETEYVFKMIPDPNDPSRSISCYSFFGYALFECRKPRIPLGHGAENAAAFAESL